MEYFINCEGIGLEENEKRIETKLRVGDYCHVQISDNVSWTVKVVKIIYYPEVRKWIFFCDENK